MVRKTTFLACVVAAAVFHTADGRTKTDMYKALPVEHRHEYFKSLGLEDATDAPTSTVPPANATNDTNNSTYTVTAPPTTTVSTDAPTDAPTAAPTDVPTTTATTVYYNVSVLGDATFRVPGKPCGGDGNLCPLNGDLAIGDCYDYLASGKGRSDSQCRAPWDAVCQVIRSVDGVDVRGCVWNEVVAFARSNAMMENAQLKAVGGLNEGTLSVSVASLAVVLAMVAVVIAVTHTPKTTPRTETTASDETVSDAATDKDEAKEEDQIVMEV
ncbi:Aste57867_22818 [Aphanomyces stellatus]|uniref:Aste57867_22818 protein n=1 Tax=Aphanomyces stellatus TaxID=120398 RepID=A0A485LMX5_9STRA|nr:hypothetical protein As57867_022748 [Aphanomyces stellatus]VFT99469.1 Aste57867_22818 [Aphanomyces stellatus]